MVRKKWIGSTVIGSLAIGAIVFAQNPSDQPTLTPTTKPSTQATYDRLLGGDSDVADRPLQPTQKQGVDKSTGKAAVAPYAPQLPTQREGTFIIDRLGRLSKAADGSGWEFTFDADGAALQDPPMKVLENLKLMVMEEAVESGGNDIRFRVSGSLTEYRGRNYILLEKVIVAQGR